MVNRQRDLGISLRTSGTKVYHKIGVSGEYEFLSQHFETRFVISLSLPLHSNPPTANATCDGMSLFHEGPLKHLRRSSSQSMHGEQVSIEVFCQCKYSMQSLGDLVMMFPAKLTLISARDNRLRKQFSDYHLEFIHTFSLN